ncbi:lipase member H-A-like [Chelonus insularis]|uniref:lipase member H-A-like n=1 Tax=Chelonus insularis TaxID=460826 RepID=UPI00158F22D5|nr:lipase member H-A-like [Chelonus insularis]
MTLQYIKNYFEIHNIMMKIIYTGYLIILIVSIENFSSGKQLLQSTNDRTAINRLNDKEWKHAQREHHKIVKQLEIKVYTGQNIDKATMINIQVDKPTIIYQYIDPLKPLVIYIHGFHEHPSNESIRTIVGAYLERGTDNIFLADWSNLAYDPYIKVVKNSPKIALVFTKIFDQLIDLGLDLKTFHIVGHSLGAQIAGFIGKFSRYLTPRITGLDPANPGFYGPGEEHIDADSAEFIDIIHTDGGFYGAISNTGTVDFFANTGTRPQPGCPLFGLPLTPADLCSHWRSWEIYAESVNNIYAFPATECSLYREFITGKCKHNQVAYVGYAAVSTIHGSYYFLTPT